MEMSASPMALDLSTSSTSAHLDVSQFQYTPYYCEENIYLLCKNLCTSGLVKPDASDLFVVFITNQKKQVALWHQKASLRDDGFIVWKFHVICIQKKKEGNVVWDLDSSLPFPSPLSVYMSETMRHFSKSQRFFRIIHAPIFLRCFASDRRDMKDSSRNWIHQPPPYEPIVAQDGTIHNLDDYVEMSNLDVVKSTETGLNDTFFTLKFGVLVSEDFLEKFFVFIP